MSSVLGRNTAGLGRSGAGGPSKPPNLCGMGELRYRVILEPEADGGFSVVIPAFPHGHTQGDTVEEALANAREVIALEIEYLRERGLPIRTAPRQVH